MKPLRLDKITKSFGNNPAVEDVSFSISEGLVTGFLGPNGAGKSTVMNIIIGFLGSTSGSAYVFDRLVSPKSHSSRRDVGFVSSISRLDRNLTVEQAIDYYGGIGGDYDKKYLSSLVRRLKLDITQKVGGLSTGNYQKCALAIALMHKPRLLVLDEPTSGLDPLIKAEFNKLIAELKAQGVTIFISSHILGEVQEICDEFIFIKKGRIVAQLTKRDLMKRAKESIVIETNSKNHDKVVQFLKLKKIKYHLDNEDLEKIFMSYYKDEHA